MLSVAEFLTTAGLGHLVPAFVRERIDDVQLLSGLDEAMLDETFGMKLGDRIKLARALQDRGFGTELLPQDAVPETSGGSSTGDAAPAAEAVEVEAGGSSTAPLSDYMACVSNARARQWWSTYVGARAASHNSVTDALGRWLELEGVHPAEAAIVAATVAFGIDRDADGEITVYEFAKYTSDLDGFTPAALRGAEAPDAEDAQVSEYAAFLGIDLVEEPELVWIAAKCMAAPLPKGWAEYTNEDGAPYFHHARKQLTSWEHPLVRRHRRTAAPACALSAG